MFIVESPQSATTELLNSNVKVWLLSLRGMDDAKSEGAICQC